MKRSLLSLLLYAVLLFVLYVFVPDVGLNISGGGLHFVVVFLLIGSVFWLVYAVIRKVLSLLAIPLNLLTFGLAGFVLNVMMLYLCQIVLMQIPLGVSMEFGTLRETVILALLITVGGKFISLIVGVLCPK